jgi:hypothetical protein
MRILLLAGLAILASMGCHTARKVAQAVPAIDTAAPARPAIDSSGILRAREDSARRAREALSRILSSRVRYQTFSAKVKVDYADSRDKSLEFNAFIRIRRDSAIWASIVAALGVEAFRVLITPDSVRIMDKLEKTVRYAAAAELQEITQLPFDFHALQELIVGNPIGPDTTATLRQQEATALLDYLQGGFRHLLTYDTAGPVLRTQRLDETDPLRNRSAILSFDQYQEKSGRNFPNLRRLTLSDRQKVDIRLDFRQVDFDLPVAFPFSVPRNYKLK